MKEVIITSYCCFTKVWFLLFCFGLALIMTFCIWYVNPPIIWCCYVNKASWPLAHYHFVVFCGFFVDNMNINFLSNMWYGDSCSYFCCSARSILNKNVVVSGWLDKLYDVFLYSVLVASFSRLMQINLWTLDSIMNSKCSHWWLTFSCLWTIYQVNPLLRETFTFPQT
jgi:hypothetical protein